MPFTFRRLKLPGLILIQPDIFQDSRGFLAEVYKYPDFAAAGIKERFVQENFARTIKKGTIRGLHFQKAPYAQAKIIQVIRGKAFDVALDLRKHSPTFGKWLGLELDAAKPALLYIPRGFAHGYCTLSDNVEIFYKCSKVYTPGFEGGVIWNDPQLKIGWPVKKPILSQRDKCWPVFRKAEFFR